jgi:hypothetical protein
MQPPHTFSPDSNKELKRRIERKIEDVLGQGQFGLRRGKGTGDAIQMSRVTSK